MDELFKAVYSVGGLSGVTILLLGYAVFHLYRSKEKEHHARLREHRDRLREVKERSDLMAQLLDKAAQRSIPPRPRPSASIPPLSDDWEDDTTVTRIREQQIHELVIRYIEEDD